jgi:hypothetical protein
MKLFFSFFLWFAFIGNPDLASIRKLYPTVTKSESNAKEFTAKLASVSDNDEAVLVGYKAASIVLSSRYEKKTQSKKDRFKEGVKLLEAAIKKEPNAIETRMIRLSIQEVVPPITGYKKNIKDDKKFLTEHYNEQSNALKEYLKSFILQSKSFSEKEKQFVK